MHKFFIKSLFVTLLLFVFALPAGAADEEFIRDFKINVDINPDASIQVKEQIAYVFGDNVKHGIFRDIPYKYDARGGKYKLRIDEINVSDTDGNPVTFKISNQGDYKHIRIGDPNISVTGIQTYVLQYRVRRALNYFDDHDELYWNATGNEWPVEIAQSRVIVKLPGAVTDKEISTECFSGETGSTDECISTRYEYKDKNQVSKIIFTNDNLNIQEGMTIVVGWPKGLVKEPGLWEKLIDLVKDNWVLALPLLVFLLMFYLWRAKGKDPEGRGTIIAYYDAPDNLGPAEIGTIIDEKTDRKDISSEIIHLAILGYLKIKRIEGKGLLKKEDYELIRIKLPDTALKGYQKELMEALFEAETVKLSDLKKDTGFYKKMQNIISGIYKNTVAEGYFAGNPKTIRSIYMVLGLALVFASWFALPTYGIIGLISLVLSGVIVMAFSFFMPKRTKSGVLVREKILGLKEYLDVAEKDRINFHNAPKKDPELFERLLPYAMVLGVEKAWAKQFKDIYRQNPSWYDDPTMSGFNTVLLASSLGNFSTKANTAMAAQSSSAAGGGSGFSGGSSGGGFGGGGGGSW